MAAKKKEWRKKIQELDGKLNLLTTDLVILKKRGGVQGNLGPTGLQGDEGIQGDRGFMGATGQQGDAGAQGKQGPSPTGPAGLSGGMGETGSQGETGSEGKKGGTGDVGQPGPCGVSGDAQRLYSKWTNSIVAPSASRVSRSNTVLSVGISAGIVGVTGVSFSVTGVSICGSILNQSAYGFGGFLSGQKGALDGTHGTLASGIASAVLTPVLAVAMSACAWSVKSFVCAVCNKIAALCVRVVTYFRTKT